MSDEPLDDLAREIMDVFWPNGTTQEQDAIFDAQLEKVKQLLQPQGKAQPESGEPLTQYVDEADLQAAFQRGQQAMAEKAAEIVNGELGDWGGPERKVLTERMQTIIKLILASAAPPQGEAEKEGRK